jgi:glycerol-3-phosphate acyltransferase PlsY
MYVLVTPKTRIYMKVWIFICFIYLCGYYTFSVLFMRNLKLIKNRIVSSIFDGLH